MLACRSLIASSMLLLLSLPARAARPPDAVALDYQPSPAAAARCPAADFLKEEVQIRIGHDLFDPGAPSGLTVTIDRVNGAYRVTGELRADDGRVTLADTFTEVECGTAIRSLAITVAIHFTRVPEPCLPLPPAAPPSTPATPLSSPAPRLRPAAPPRGIPERPRVQVGIAAAFSMGTAPVVVGGASWFLGVRWPGFSTALEGRALFAPSGAIEGARVRDGYRFLVADLAASGCVHPTWAFACLQIAWGSLSVSNPAVNIDPNRVSHLGFGFRFGGERALTRALALRAYTDALFDFGPGDLRYLMSGARVVWHKPTFSGAVGFGPVMTF